MDWGLLGSIFAMFSMFSGLMVWLVTRIENRLDAHITSSDAKWLANEAKWDAKWIAINQRADALSAQTNKLMVSLNARVDTTQAIIMRMLEKQGK